MKMNDWKKIVCLGMGTTFLLFSACKKASVSDPDFAVSVEKTTYDVNDSVTFEISGNPDVIVFYSGETGNDYAFRDRVQKDSGKLKMSFQVRASNTAAFAAIAKKNLQVLASNNFTVNYSTDPDSTIASHQDSLLVNAATWADITDRFALPISGSFALFYNSKEADLSDLVNDPNQPLNLAFKFSGSNIPFLGANGISISNMNLYSKFPNGDSSSFNLAPGGSNSTVWNVVNAANPLNKWLTSTSQLKFTSSSKATAFYTEDWVVSTEIYPNAATPDIGLPLKNISNPMVKRYKYAYAKPGNYNIVFLAKNSRDLGETSKLVQIPITITQ